jgi:hypothetical protein
LCNPKELAFNNNPSRFILDANLSEINNMDNKQNIKSLGNIFSSLSYAYFSSVYWKVPPF